MKYGLEMSASQELDVIGMQPHSREYLEYKVIREVADYKGSKTGVSGIERGYDEGEYAEGFGSFDRDHFCHRVNFSETP